MAQAPNSPAQFTGQASFEFDGQEYFLTIDNMAMLEAEEMVGRSLVDWVPELVDAIKTSRSPQIKHLAAIVYGGLKVNHPDMTPRSCVSMMMTQDPAIMSALVQAMEAVDVPDDPVGNKPGPEQSRADRKTRRVKKAGAGTRSSDHGAKRGKTRRASGGKRRDPRS